MTVKRTTQVAAEAISNVTAKGRTTQVAVEAVSSNSLKMIMTQIIAEMVSENVPDDSVGSQPIMLVIAT